MHPRISNTVRVSCGLITKQFKQTPFEEKQNDIVEKEKNHSKTRRQKQVQLTITTVIQFAADFYPNHNKTEFA